MISRQKLYAMGEPFGESCTRHEAGRVVYGGGGGGGGKSTTTPMIPEEFKPLANRYSEVAMDYSNRPFQAYSGQRFADLNTAQNLGIGMVQDRALGGSQTINNAEGQLNNMIQGGQTNPYLDQMVGRAQKSVTDQFNMNVRPSQIQQAIASGSFGNSGLQEAQAMQDSQLQQNLGDIASSMYGNAYEGDRARQMQAIGMAPTFGNMAYQDAAQLMNAGGIQQDQVQKNLDFGFDQFNQQQDYPLKQLQAMSGVLGQTMGSQTKQSGGGK